MVVAHVVTGALASVVAVLVGHHRSSRRYRGRRSGQAFLVKVVQTLLPAIIVPIVVAVITAVFVRVVVVVVVPVFVTLVFVGFLIRICILSCYCCRYRVGRVAVICLTETCTVVFVSVVVVPMFFVAPVVLAPAVVGYIAVCGSSKSARVMCGRVATSNCTATFKLKQHSL